VAKNPLSNRYRYHARELKIHPRIGLACLRASKPKGKPSNRGKRNLKPQRIGYERELRLWYLARLVDRDGAGWLAVTDLQQRLDGLGTSGLSPSVVRRLLQTGNGIFWHLHEKQGQRFVRLAGVEAVAKHFGVYRLDAPVYVPIEHANGLQSWRGAIVAAFHAQRGGSQTWTSPISRATLERLTGAPRCTIYRWEQALGASFQSKRNAAVAKDEWPRDVKAPEGCYIDKSVLSDGTEVITLLSYLPNSYRSGWQLAPRGMLRKVNRGLKRLVSVGVLDDFNRLFWSDPKAINRALTGLQEGGQVYILGAEILGKNAPATRAGRKLGPATLWTSYRRDHGQLRNREPWL